MTPSLFARRNGPRQRDRDGDLKVRDQRRRRQPHFAIRGQKSDYRSSGYSNLVVAVCEIHRGKGTIRRAPKITQNLVRVRGL